VLQFDVVSKEECTGEGGGGISHSGEEVGKGIYEEGEEEGGEDGALKEPTKNGKRGRAGAIDNDTGGEVVCEQGFNEGEGRGGSLSLSQDGEELVVRDGVVCSSKIQEDMEAIVVEESCFMRCQREVERGLVALKSTLIGVDGGPRLVVPLGDEVKFEIATQDLGQ
jgi:hypothetical protein